MASPGTARPNYPNPGVPVPDGAKRSRGPGSPARVRYGTDGNGIDGYGIVYGVRHQTFGVSQNLRAGVAWTGHRV